MDNRIGIIGGIHPQQTLSGLPVPDRPYPITRQLDATHYVVQDIHPTVDVEAIIAQLRGELGDEVVQGGTDVFEEEEDDEDTDTE